MAKGGSGKVFFVSASSSYFLFKVGGGLPPSPPPDNVGNVVLGGRGKRDRETKVLGFIMWQTFFRRGGTLGLSRNSLPSPLLSLLLFFFALLCNVHHRRHSGARYCCCMLFPCLGSRCVRLLATLFAAGGRHFGALAAFPKNAPLHPQFVFLGGERSVEYSRPASAPILQNRPPPPPPDGCSLVMHFTLTPPSPTHSGKL